MIKFSDLPLSDKTLDAIKDAGYREPTPIQSQVIPYVLQGLDLFGCAQTGTGKTASYTLPILDILSASRQRARLPRVLILTPTRELAQQVEQSFDKYGKNYAYKVSLLIGGESIYDQEKKLQRGSDILIATPGRLLDLIERSKILPHAIEILVIDEADRMLDMGFIPDIDKIKKLIPEKCQTLLFSATLSDEIKKITKRFLKSPIEVFATRPSQTAETIEEYLIKFSEENKRALLQTLIQQERPKNAIIFCNRKRDISTLCQFLCKNKYNAAPLHGDLQQSERTRTLQDFKDGQIQFLIASDVAARGIDVEALSYVVNFDVPTNPEEYIHRIGRTGRAGHTGKAYTFVSKKDTKQLKLIEKLIGHTIQEMPLSAAQEDTPPLPASRHDDRPSILEKQTEPTKRREKTTAVVKGFGDITPRFMLEDLLFKNTQTSKEAPL